MINSSIIHYGVEHPSQSIEIRNKIISTCLERYGVEHPSQYYKIKERTLLSRNCNRRYDLSEYEIYRYKVDKLTSKNKKKLYEMWNGYDYYENIYIKDNFILNFRCSDYPSIDHKKSVFYCFLNNISQEECSNIDNLCITTRSNNSKKNRKNEKEFIELFFNNSLL